MTDVRERLNARFVELRKKMEAYDALSAAEIQPPPPRIAPLQPEPSRIIHTFLNVAYLRPSAHVSVHRL